MRNSLILASALAVSVTACGQNPTEESYEDFVDRSEPYRVAPDVDIPTIVGEFRDVTGADQYWNIKLNPIGGVLFGLRATFLTWEPNEDNTEARVTGEFRVATAPEDSTPLASFETTMNEFGIMQIRIADCTDPTDASTCGPIYVPPNLSPIEDTAVSTQFVLDVIIINEFEQCGLIAQTDALGNNIVDQSQVYEPIGLPLSGTTFGGLLFDDVDFDLESGVATNVEVECPFEEPEGDVGADVGVDAPMDTGGDTGPPLEPPPDTLEGGMRADVTGRFFMDVNAAGILGLGLIADFIYYDDPETGGAVLDGSLRNAEDSAALPALAQFTTEVDEDGEFVVIVPNLRVSTIVADVALRGMIIDADTICGLGAGNATEPLVLALDGTTFGAVRLADESSFLEPEVSINACP